MIRIGNLTGRGAARRFTKHSSLYQFDGLRTTNGCRLRRASLESFPLFSHLT